MPTTFNAGDIVELKSGVPYMTIEKVNVSVHGEREVSYTCSWFAGAKDNRKVFAEAALKAADLD